MRSQSKVKRLLDCYLRHISIPWGSGVPSAQRVLFCVYPETEELRLRAGITEFALQTQAIGHRWELFDLTDTFAVWMAGQSYAEAYFAQPDLLPTLLHRYREHVEHAFSAFCSERAIDESTVVALLGVGTLFGFLKVKQVVDAIAPIVPGRLVVLFPGSNEGNNYRLLDAYDGWNYLAIPITPECDI